MLLTCSRCSRVNPPEALFCYNDGAALGDPSRRHGVTDPARQRFPMPFVFPSGKACHTFDEMVLATLEHWDAARDLLRHGVFTNFLAGLGRADLSMAAREAAAYPDADRGLDQLLGRLPAQVLKPAKLGVEPGQLNLGTMRPGQDSRFTIRLSNEGMGLLHGTISCAECPWLSLGDPAAGTRKKIFQFLHDNTIQVNVCGKSLRAGNRPQEGKIVIESSGGTFTVLVNIEVPVTPFPEGVLTGALTPRQIAEKAKAHPRDAAVLFARGAVAKWYAANGWTYPVTEPSASGVAAVQQFFEALGLTTPPKVGINVADLRLEGRGGDIVRSSVQVTSPEKRPVYAHAVSDQPWLTVNDVALEGRMATVNLRVPEVPNCPGEVLRAKLTITANGRQKFVVPVSLTVTGSGAGPRFMPAPPVSSLPTVPPGRSSLPDLPPVGTNGGRSGHSDEILEVLPIAPNLPAPPPPGFNRERDRDRDRRRPDEDDREVPRRGGGGGFLAVLPVIFLLLGLLVTLGRDVYAWVTGERGGNDNSLAFKEAKQVLHIQFHDQETAVALARGGGGVKPTLGGPAVKTQPGYWEPSMRFGLTMVDKFGIQKKLTYQPDGSTNNTCVKLDGGEYLFGERPFRFASNGAYADEGHPERWPGRWLERSGKPDRPLRDGRKSVWVYDSQKIHITQEAGLVPGAQSGDLDTCLIHYKIENKDRTAHTVGLRFLLDTFIGGNDGVPYLIPGQKELCSTMTEFNRPEDVPDFIQARESADLTNPGTVAQIQLKIPGMEPPSRVTLGAWPDPKLNQRVIPGFFENMGKARPAQEKTLWDVPVLSMKTLVPNDSCVVIYWPEKSLAPGATRELSFAYGLGNVASSEGGGRLALTVGGSFVPNGEFTLTAYVSNPVAGQTLTLALPEGFTIISGAQTETVAAGFGSGTVPVTWKVKAGPREGKYNLKVKSSTGVSQTQLVRIKVSGIFGN
jgi:hypothetical protein